MALRAPGTAPYGNNAGLLSSSFSGSFPVYGAPGGVSSAKSLSNGAFPIAFGPPQGATGMDVPFGNMSSMTDAPTVGWDANTSVPHHYIVLADQNQPLESKAYLEFLTPGMLVFVKNPNYVSRHGHHRASRFNHPESPDTAELLDWNQVNDNLLKQAKRCRDNNDPDYYECAEDVLRAWRLLGVIKTEVAPNTDMNYGKRAECRTLNLIVSGRVAISNVFGSGVRAGTPLYFVVRKEQVYYESSPLWTWRIVPYACRDDMEWEPPLYELLSRKPSTRDRIMKVPTYRDLCDPKCEDAYHFDIGTFVRVGIAAEGAGGNYDQLTPESSWMKRSTIPQLSIHMAL